MSTRKLRSGRGLGDAVYLQSIAREFPKHTVCTDWPMLFPNRKTEPFTRQGVDVIAHYNKRREENTNQWQDMCISAGVETELRFEWDATKTDKKILFVAAPREPMARADQFARELLPDRDVFNKVLRAIKGKYFTALSGTTPLYDLDPSLIDLDLTGCPISQYLDTAKQASAFIGQPSNIIPLAEGQNKKCLVIWSGKGLQSCHMYIRTVTPKKLISKPTTKYLIDNWSQEKMEDAISAFRFGS